MEGAPVILTLYRLAWEPLWWSARALAAAGRIRGGASRAAQARGPTSWRLRERLSTTVPCDTPSGEAPAETIWLHAASLGECKGLWAVAQQLATELMREGMTDTGPVLPDTRILLTTNTVAGLTFLRRGLATLPSSRDRHASGRRVLFAARLAPLDHPALARAFLAENSIRALVLFEVELWPHWVAAARRAGVPVLWISARLTPRARRRYAGNRLFAGALGRVLRDLTWIQTQTENEEHALRRLGAPRVETGGDLRGLHSLRSHPNPSSPGSADEDRTPRADSLNVRRGGIVFVSFHAHELPTLVAALRTERDEGDALPQTPLLIFPRKLHEVPTFVRLLSPYGFVLHSERATPREPGDSGERAQGATTERNPLRVIVDAYGLVDAHLAHAHTAVIGGSFDPEARIGGHNAWEPLRAGCRMIIGPHHHNQRALVDRLKERGLIRVAHDGAELREDLTRAAGAALSATHPQVFAEQAAHRACVAEESARLEAAAARACHMIVACARSNDA